jgi:membrane associated rhomboid family serine protease
MVEAPVGWQCPQCTSEGAKRSRHVPAFTHTSRGRTGVVGSTNPTPIVLTIIAINVVVFFLEGFGTNARVVDRYAMWPAAVHLENEYYRAFTAMWLHASFTHIFFNMIALLIVGPALEVLLGKARFLVLYLLAGLGGSVSSYILSQPNVAGIGASGAIMGVLGAYVVVGLRRRLPVAPVVGLLVLNFVIGFTGNIDWRAHLGGLVTGCVLAFVYDYAGGLPDRTTAQVLTVGGSVAVLALLALLITSIAPGHFNLS